MLTSYYNLPFQIILVYRFITNGTFMPTFLTQGQVMQYTGPAVDVTTASHFSGDRRVQTDRTRWKFRNLHMLQKLILFVTCLL